MLSLSPNKKICWVLLKNYSGKAAVEENSNIFCDRCLISWLSSFSLLDVSSFRSKRDPYPLSICNLDLAYPIIESWISSNQGRINIKKAIFNVLYGRCYSYLFHLLKRVFFAENDTQNLAYCQRK